MSSRSRVTRADSVAGKQPRRQANACLRCYEKKVKCDMDPLGQPCTGCARDGITCQKRTRKPYPPRKEASSAAASKVDAPRSSPARTSIPPTQIPTPPRSVHSEAVPSPTALFSPDQFDYSSSCLEQSGNDFFNSVHDVSVAVLHTPGQDIAMTDPAALFNSRSFHSTSQAPTDTVDAGDEQDYAYLLHLCHAQQSSAAQHNMGPESSTASLGPEELTYAEAKGCFSLPIHAICDDLVQCYFHYVHPMLPIISIADFLEQYTHGAFDETSLLLLWSMFSVAAHHASDATLALSGYASRPALKKSMYERAKCLYDLGYERNQITVVQSTLLLGRWCSELQNPAQSWHWTGIAISTAQAAGLHRDPDAGHFGSTIPTPRRRLCANLWWCCFYQDRLLSLGHGKPLRINADDCDLPMVGPGCMLELPDRAPKVWHKYVPAELPHLYPVWSGLLKLAVVLGNILSVTYQARKAVLDSLSIANLERQIVECVPERQPHLQASELLSFFQSYASLHVEAAVIALYRPCAPDFSAPGFGSTDFSIAQLANERVRAAATRAVGILDALLSNKTLRFAGPMMIHLLLPSMAIESMPAKSLDSFPSSWCRSRLDLYLLVLNRLENSGQITAPSTQVFTPSNSEELLPFDLSRPSSISSLNSCYEDGSQLWPGTPHGLAHNSAAGLSSQPPLWQSPAAMNQNMGVWSFKPPDDELFFPLDDINTTRI